MVILDINFSVLMLIEVSFNLKEASLFQRLVLRVAEIIEDSAPILIYSFQFIIF